MSRSYLRNNWMQKIWGSGSNWASRWHIKYKNKYRRDEEPKNNPSKYITMHCSADVHWLQESTSFGGHSIPKGGHRRVSGLVRASVKRETQEEIKTQLEEDNKV